MGICERWRNIKNKIFRKGLAVGFILLFLCLVYTPIINAETNSFISKSIKFSVYNILDNYKEFKVSFFVIERIRGEITDLEILGEHNYHFNITKVVDSYIYTIFLWGIIPLLPVYQKGVMENVECFLKFEGNYLFIKEEITENHIDIIFIWWDEIYPASLN